MSIYCFWDNCNAQPFQSEVDCYNHIVHSHAVVGKQVCQWRCYSSTNGILCNIETKHKGHFTEHAVSHFSYNLRPIKCTYLNCSHAFRNRQDLRRHQLKFHSGNLVISMGEASKKAELVQNNQKISTIQNQHTSHHAVFEKSEKSEKSEKPEKIHNTIGSSVYRYPQSYPQPYYSVQEGYPNHHEYYSQHRQYKQLYYHWQPSPAYEIPYSEVGLNIKFFKSYCEVLRDSGINLPPNIFEVINTINNRGGRVPPMIESELQEALVYGEHPQITLAGLLTIYSTAAGVLIYEQFIKNTLAEAAEIFKILLENKVEQTTKQFTTESKTERTNVRSTQMSENVLCVIPTKKNKIFSNNRTSPQNIATAADAKKLPTTTPDEHADMTDIIDDPKLVEKDIFKTEKLAISTVKKHLVDFLKIFWKNVCECFSNEDQSEFIEIPNPNTSEDETMVMLRIMILHELEKLSNTIRRRFYFEAVKNLQENLYKLFNFETTGSFFRTSLMDFDKTSLCLYCKFGSNEKWVYTKPPINTENSFPSGFLI